MVQVKDVPYNDRVTFVLQDGRPVRVVSRVVTKHHMFPIEGGVVVRGVLPTREGWMLVDPAVAATLDVDIDEIDAALRQAQDAFEDAKDLL